MAQITFACDAEHAKKIKESFSLPLATCVQGVAYYRASLTLEDALDLIQVAKKHGVDLRIHRSQEVPNGV